MKKTIFSLSVVIALIILMFKCNSKSSLDFEEVKFNTPEKVIAELDLKDFPEFSYIGNTTYTDFNWDYWDCLVEFQFEDTLSVQAKENIIKQVVKKDTLHWKYKDIPKEGVAEFYNIKYSDTDTIPYNIIITDTKIHVAYNNNANYHSMSNELFNPTDYHLLVARNFHFGIDSGHEWIIQLKKPYTQYLDTFKESDGWECKKTSSSIYFIKETTQDYNRINIIKKRNIAIIEYGTY